MGLLLKILKISLLLLLIFVLAVVFTPTSKGAFVIIHFTTTLQAIVLVQVVFTALAIAAHARRGVLTPVFQVRLRSFSPVVSACTPIVNPLRC